jgi:hypothetical protein
MLMQNLERSPYVHFKRLVYVKIFLFKLEILIRKHFCQIDDFTMHLWHLNKVHFVENPKRYKK